MRQLKESQEAVKLHAQSAPLGIVSGGYLDWSLPVDYSSRYESQEAPEVIHFAKKKKKAYFVLVYHVIVSMYNISWSDWHGPGISA